MADASLLINDFPAFTNGKRSMVVDLEANGEFGVFPAGYKYPGGKHRLTVESDGTGNVSFRLGDEPVSDPLMSLFCFVDGVITLTGDVTVEKAWVADHAELRDIPESVRIFGGDVGTPGIAVELPSRHNRSVAVVTPTRDCQVHFDFTQGEASRSAFGVTVDHRVSDQASSYVNVLFDRHKDGVWLPESRIKLGYFDYRSGEPYTINFSVVPEPGEDGYDATLNVSITHQSRTKVMRSIARLSSLPIMKVVARGSGTDSIGAYEVTAPK